MSSVKAELLGADRADVSTSAAANAISGPFKKFIEAMNGDLVLAPRFHDGVKVPTSLPEAEDAAQVRVRDSLVRKPSAPQISETPTLRRYSNVPS